MSRLSFSNQGQICLCGSRILVQAGIYDRFKNDLIQKAETIKIGDPMEDGTQFGSLISEDHLNKVMNFIDLAKKEGGICLTGGERKQMDGRCKMDIF